MDLLAPVRAVDRFQRRHAVLAVPYAVIKKFGDDQSGHHAALIAYYGFFSLFPLLLLFTTVLGFVLQGDPGAQQAVVKSAVSQFPIVGDSLKAHALSGNGVALAIGIVGALLSGLGVTLAAQTAFNVVFAVPYKERPNAIMARLHGLGLLAALGTLQVLSTVASGLVTGGFGGVLLTIAGVAISLLLNLLLFVAAFRLLTDNSVPTRHLWPGIIAAAILWEILQAVGGVYIGHVIKGAGRTYGTFAIVIGLLTWLFLGARVVVYAAQLNSVLVKRLWPRGILDPPTEADEQHLRALAKMEERKPTERVDVTFEEP